MIVPYIEKNLALDFLYTYNACLVMNLFSEALYIVHHAQFPFFPFSYPLFSMYTNVSHHVDIHLHGH